MSLEVLTEVNYLAVLVAALVYFGLGAVWYINPLIARVWQRSGGIEVPEDGGPNPVVFMATLLCYVVAVLATAMLAVATGTEGAGEGAILGLVVGVGYALTAAAVSAIYDRKPQPLTWFLVNGTFNAGALVVVGVIIGVWR